MLGMLVSVLGLAVFLHAKGREGRFWMSVLIVVFFVWFKCCSYSSLDDRSAKPLTGPMTGDGPHLPKPQRSRWLKALALLVIASGLGLAVFTAWAWGPIHEDEWPGFLPFVLGTGSLLLIWWGAGLWTGTWSGWWPGGPDG